MPGSHDREIFINVRKLAALDMALHGARFILAEFTLGVLLCGAAGVWVLARGDRSALTLFLGGVLLSAALNYLPLLLHAISLARGSDPRTEVKCELEQRDRYFRKYTIQQLLILVPLAIVLLAVVQARPTGARGS